MKGKNIVLTLCMMLCMLFMIQNVHADPMDGTAYAVLTDDGELILFRSTETYSDGDNTVTDINGDSYTGHVYTGIETINPIYINYSRVIPWYAQIASINSVRVANGQTIKPINCCYWFYCCSTCNSMDLTGLDTGNVMDMRYMFYGCRGLTNLSISFNTANVTNMESMFSGCSGLTNLDLSSFNTVNVTTMQSMFSGCSGLTCLDVSSFNTGNVTNMSGMFSNCSCLTSLDLSNFNTANVTDMFGMFYICSGLTSLNLSSFNTENVTTMKNMFRECSGLTSLDLSSFNTGNVTNMDDMFYKCSGLTALDLSNFNTGNVTDMSYMFYGCSGLTSLDLNTFNTGNVTNMSEMFDGCSSLTSLDLSSFNTGNVTSMSSMFSYCSGLTNLSINFNTAKVTNMSQMFYGCSGLTSFDLSSFNTGNVTNMSYMFFNCNKLTSLDLSSCNTGNVTNMGNMFSYCSGLTALNLSSFDTRNVTRMDYMFYGCSGLTSLDLSRFNTEKVTNMGGMFSGCSGLTSLDLSSFNTGNATTMQSMFSGCSGLISLDVSRFNTEKVTNMSQMFRDCNKLTSFDLSSFNTENATSMYQMFYGCSGLTSLDLSTFNTTKVTSMGSMFYICNKLSSVILGYSFSFKGKNITSTSNQAVLPTPPTSVTRDTVNYTQKWIRDDEAYGPYTPYELLDNYDGTRMSGTWVWEEVPTKYKVVYLPPDETYSGSMPIQKFQPDGDAILNKCTFYKFDEHLSYWQGNDSRTYTDEGTIPANRFHVGDTLTLTAVFEPNDHHLRQTDGIATLTLHGGEKITLPDLKGGVTYQVWEDMPSGWQQTSQTTPAGKIMANETINSTFTNEYVPGTATITLMAQKTLDGRMPEDDAFEFTLSSTTGIVETVTNKQGMVTFKPLIFTQPGTYVYTISEVRGDDDGINYDPHTETISITVADDGYGNLTATTDQSELPVFENMTKRGTLTITKETNIATDETFTFEIVLENEYGQSLDEITVVKNNHT